MQGRARLQIGGRARGGAHVEHAAHGGDAGGVEAQRLVERRRVLPRVKKEACGAGRGIRVGRREAAGDRGASSVQERARLQIQGRARGGAHGEQIAHICDTRGVPVGYVRVEILQVFEEVAHVGDARDVPVGDGAVRRSGRSFVGVVRFGRRPQVGLACEYAGWGGRRWPGRAGETVPTPACGVWRG